LLRAEILAAVPANTSEAILSTDDGTVKLVNPAPLKAEEPMLSKWLPVVSKLNILLQYLKALEPMVASWLVPAPNVTVFRLVHDWKADVPIVAKEAGRLSSVID
jgi:hypothetical protein